MTWFSIAGWKERRRALRDLGRLQYLDHQVLTAAGTRSPKFNRHVVAEQGAAR